MNKITTLFFLLLLSGCSSTVPSPSKVALSPLNFHPHEQASHKSQIVIFNSSNQFLPYHSGVMKLKINGKGIGQIDIGEYIIVELDKGEHEITLIQQDVFMYESVHSFNVRYETHYIDVYAQLFENGFEATHSLPVGYESAYE